MDLALEAASTAIGARPSLNTVVISPKIHSAPLLSAAGQLLDQDRSGFAKVYTGPSASRPPRRYGPSRRLKAAFRWAALKWRTISPSEACRTRNREHDHHAMADEEYLQTLIILSNRARLKAFRLMVEAGPGGIKAGALSPHLAILLRSCLAEVRSEGRHRFYVANKAALAPVLTFLMCEACGLDEAAVTSALAGLGLGDDETAADAHGDLHLKQARG